MLHCAAWPIIIDSVALKRNSGLKQMLIYQGLDSMIANVDALILERALACKACLVHAAAFADMTTAACTGTFLWAERRPRRWLAWRSTCLACSRAHVSDFYRDQHDLELSKLHRSGLHCDLLHEPPSPRMCAHKDGTLAYAWPSALEQAGRSRRQRWPAVMWRPGL